MSASQNPETAFCGTSRRRFLGKAALAAAWVLEACSRKPQENPSTKESILIVGGGLSGLYALHRLRQAGRATHLFEAAPRLGGRIRTLRKGLPEGLLAELGAERIPQGHQRLQRLLSELQLPVSWWQPPEGRLSLRLDGEIYRFTSPQDLPSKLRQRLAPNEREHYPFELFMLHASQDRPVQREDPRSGLAWLKDQGYSPLGLRLAEALCPLPLKRMSAHAFWRQCLRQRKNSRAGTIKGGVEQIVSALSLQHAQEIHTATTIKSVTLTPHGVVLRDQQSRARRGAMVILALPPRPLFSLEIRPQIPSLITSWQQSLSLGEEVKLHMLYSSRELEKKRLAPYIMGTGFPRMTWPGLTTGADGRRVLNALALREDLPRLASLQSGAQGALLSFMKSRLPMIQSLESHIFSHDFNRDPLIGSTFAFQKVGAPPHPASVRSGRLVLAGSDVSSHSGWMEGALEAADRAVNEVLAS